VFRLLIAVVAHAVHMFVEVEDVGTGGNGGPRLGGGPDDLPLNEMNVLIGGFL
jgi:hypothetical protein